MIHIPKHHIRLARAIDAFLQPVGPEPQTEDCAPKTVEMIIDGKLVSLVRGEPVC